MTPRDKHLIVVGTEIKTPPLSKPARLEAGYLIRLLQTGERLSMPESRPMPGIGKRCHELRIRDSDTFWRIIYRIDPDAIVVVDVFKKKTEATPRHRIKTAQQRFSDYDADRKHEKKKKA